MTTRTATSRTARLDQICADAVGLARGAITDVDPSDIGEHIEAVAEGDRLVTHFFESHLAGYRGWRWAVTVTRVPRSRHVTVCETVLLPGPDALLAPGYVLSDDPAVEEISWELGLGRPRVMSREGRMETAQRWYDGESGPEAPIAIAAPRNARCGTCGFYLPLAGSLRQMFGVCGNIYAPDDGRAVSADHGCGAHSEALLGSAEVPVEELPTVYDDSEVEAVAVSRAHGSVEESEPAEDYGHS